MKQQRIQRAVDIINYAIKNKISAKEASIKYGCSNTYVKNTKAIVYEKHKNGILNDDLFDLFNKAYQNYLKSRSWVYTTSIEDENKNLLNYADTEQINTAIKLIQYAIEKKISIKESLVKLGYSDKYVDNTIEIVFDKHEKGLLNNELFNLFNKTYQNYLKNWVSDPSVSDFPHITTTGDSLGYIESLVSLQFPTDNLKKEFKFGRMIDDISNEIKCFNLSFKNVPHGKSMIINIPPSNSSMIIDTTKIGDIDYGSNNYKKLIQMIIKDLNKFNN